MHTVIRILLEQGDEGQVNYLPGTLQPHHAAPGHEEAGCSCRATVNAVTPGLQNGYMCRYDMDPCTPTALCDNKRFLYDEERALYDRKRQVLIDAATGMPVTIPCDYDYYDTHDDDVSQTVSAPTEGLHAGLHAGSAATRLRYTPFELRHRPLNPHTDEYETIHLTPFGGDFGMPH